MTDSTKVPNRLINETSPYLLQHAYNPVDWWPWCNEPLQKQKPRISPVFLSIGYSTCHWCHFDSQAIAKALPEARALAQIRDIRTIL